MVGELFEQARLDPPECPASFVRDNLAEIASSEISPFVVVEMAGRVATGAFEPGAERDLIAQINDRRIRGDRRPKNLFRTMEAMK